MKKLPHDRTRCKGATPGCPEQHGNCLAFALSHGLIASLQMMHRSQKRRSNNS
ncbi:MAG: hypothetical protein ABI648_03940 [Betaproteobacteria bacterium]|jgi:hypothetical protein